MLRKALAAQDIDHLYALSGQAAALARAEPAGDVMVRLWREARSLLA